MSLLFHRKRHESWMVYGLHRPFSKRICLHFVYKIRHETKRKLTNRNRIDVINGLNDIKFQFEENLQNFRFLLEMMRYLCRF